MSDTLDKLKNANPTVDSPTYRRLTSRPPDRSLDPDPLTVYPEPDTDDEPWRVPGSDPDARHWWAFAIAAVALFVVAVAWWR